MAKKLVVLDPGHGGRDPGAVGNGLLEKEITLMLARKVAKRLGFYDVAVKLTRDDDTYLSLEARANFANNLGADYFLSIHVNAGGGTGFESFIYNGPVNASTSSYRSIIHKNIVAFLKNYGVVDRGEKTANFVVLRETIMPAVLIENLFIDTAKDAALLKDDEFINGLCDGITRGIVNALKLSPASPEPEPKPTPAPEPTPTPPPVGPPVWNPQQEIQKLKEAGLLANDHPADAPVTWGEFATVINRLLHRINND
ncbi:N-acetylmuramoyl-L-alanine amidase family protein [Desulforamulus putei]|uniref:N-acetylmuramoyl-L-alanine amidase n=1 Tax=Desulforamulus putei DSM 12395 TaxID=1121429 RepID=A0A1M4YMH7_9FIRM|nr:N-acetylmuramoyl-L-alanine amidase [Desulforamulus putei]SHF07025.1 N-acetylmuramoyl-L-alanine amidase [Desulforamulus putei DSM 12395]